MQQELIQCIDTAEWKPINISRKQCASLQGVRCFPQ